VRAKAITMRRIADILKAREQGTQEPPPS